MMECSCTAAHLLEVSRLETLNPKCGATALPQTCWSSWTASRRGSSNICPRRARRAPRRTACSPRPSPQAWPWRTGSAGDPTDLLSQHFCAFLLCQEKPALPEKLRMRCRPGPVRFSILLHENSTLRTASAQCHADSPAELFQLCMRISLSLKEPSCRL